MASLEAEMLEFIRRGLDHHAQSCPLAPKAILLNPGNHELFGWDELWGIPVLADDRVAPKRFRIDCDGSAFGIEAEISEVIAIDEPLVIPVGPGGPREGEPTAAARAPARRVDEDGRAHDGGVDHRLARGVEDQARARGVGQAQRDLHQEAAAEVAARRPRRARRRAGRETSLSVESVGHSPTRREAMNQASSPEAIREHASRADLPVDEIIAVADTVLVRPDPQTASI
jgi:hypothetical protein